MTALAISREHSFQICCSASVLGIFAQPLEKVKVYPTSNKPLLSSSSSKALLMAVGPLYRQAKLHAAIFVERVASPRPAKRPATEISSSS